LERHEISPTSDGALELRNRYGRELRQMIEEASEQGREVGLMLCQDSSGQIHLGQPCWGQRSTVTVRDCHGMIPVGSFHVHLRGVDVFSPPDFDIAIRKEDLSCVGYVKDGRPMMKCITPQKFYEYPLTERLNIRGALGEARVELDRLKAARPSYSSLCSIPPGEIARLALTGVAQKLGALEIAL